MIISFVYLKPIYICLFMYCTHSMMFVLLILLCMTFVVVRYCTVHVYFLIFYWYVLIGHRNPMILKLKVIIFNQETFSYYMIFKKDQQLMLNVLCYTRL